MKHIHLGLIIRSLASVLMLSLVSFSTINAMSNDDIVTDIILINGEAVLVDLDHKGEVLKRYLGIPNYFYSSRTHESLRRSTLIKSKGLSKAHKLFDANHFLSTETSLCTISTSDYSSIMEAPSTTINISFFNFSSTRESKFFSPFYKSYAIRRVNYLA